MKRRLCNYRIGSEIATKESFFERESAGQKGYKVR